MPRYWINTVSRDHVLVAIEGGFTQADHGKGTRLSRLRRGDKIAFYSPRTAMGSGETLQEFTGLATVTGEAPYQVETSADFHPWRLEVEFADLTPASIRPLIEELSFISDPKRWGLPFRRGLFEVEARDMDLIRTAMAVR